jgi:hypothetical protein
VPDPARLAALFDEASELPPAALPGFLARHCGDDPELRAALVRLLAHDREQGPEFLARPAIACPEEHVPEDMPEGTHVAGLLLEREIGRGAAGTVYAARDQTLDRRVAVKLLRAGAGGWTAAAVAEARALARLSHPNVVQIHELREHAGALLLVMELVEGASLHAWVRQQPRGWRAVLAAFVQAGRGLAAAHALGIVHGDFKPDNVLVGDDGRVRVVDFGLAHLAARRGEPAGVGFAGTPSYMDLAQLRGAAGDRHSDQFSFCAALYTCLFGQPPFPAADVAGLIARLADPPTTPPPGEVPAPVIAALLKGLAQDRGDRWPDMDALLGALDRELARDPENDLGVARRQRLVLMIALLVVTLGVDAWIFLRPRAVAFDLSATDLVVVMAGVFVALLAMIAASWRALRRNRANRQLAGLMVAVLAAMLVHRLIARELGTPVLHTLVVDLLLMATCGAVSALLFRARFAAIAVLYLLAAVAAALDPDSAPKLFSATTATTFALALLGWRSA